jgi:MFS family permease
MGRNKKNRLGIALSTTATCGIAFGLSRHILPVIYPKMQSAIGSGVSNLGYLTTAYFISYTFFVLFFGHISDKIGSRNIIGISCLTCGVGTFFIGFSYSLATLLSASFIIGAGAAGLFVPMVSWILRRFERRKGLIISILLAGEGCSGFSVGFIIPKMVDLFSWRHVWRYFGLALLGLSVLLWAMISDGVNKSIKLDPEVNKEKTIFFRELMNFQKLKNLGLVYFLHGLTRGILVTFSVSFLVSRNIDYATASGAFSCLSLGFIPGAIVSGILCDRFKKKFVLLSLFLLEAISIGMIIFNANITIIYFLYITVGFCLTGIPTVMNTFPPELVPKNIYGKAVGLLSLVFNIGAAISPTIGGYLSDSTGSLIYPIFFSFLVVWVAVLITFSKI